MADRLKCIVCRDSHGDFQALIQGQSLTTIVFAGETNFNSALERAMEAVREIRFSIEPAPTDL